MAGIYVSLSDEGKDFVVNTCKKFISLAEKARREGILALEEHLYDDEFYEGLPPKAARLTNILIRYVTDGTDGEIIEKIADNYIATSCDDDAEKLYLTIVKNGTLSVQRGDNPRIMQEIFISYIGLDSEKEFREKSGFKEDWY